MQHVIDFIIYCIYYIFYILIESVSNAIADTFGNTILGYSNVAMNLHQPWYLCDWLQLYLSLKCVSNVLEPTDDPVGTNYFNIVCLLNITYLLIFQWPIRMIIY